MSAATLDGLIDTLAAARHAGGFRYGSQERVLRQFARHFRQEGYADGSIVKEAVEEFLYGRHLKASTIRREEIVLRDLAEHARQLGWRAWAPPALTRVKAPHRPPPYVFSDEEVSRLFRAIDTQPLSENSNRALVDPVLFRVLYGTGLRLSEALGLELRDFDPIRATLEIRDGKNHENRLVPITGRLAATVGSYIAAAHPCPEPGHRLFHTGDPSRPADKSRFTTGSAVTSPTPASRISPAARTSTRCATASPWRTCAGAGPALHGARPVRRPARRVTGTDRYRSGTRTPAAAPYSRGTRKMPGARGKNQENTCQIGAHPATTQDEGSSSGSGHAGQLVAR